jgi:hypothetical protein
VASFALAQIVAAASFGTTPSSASVGRMRLDLEPDPEPVCGSQMATISGRE